MRGPLCIVHTGTFSGNLYTIKFNKEFALATTGKRAIHTVYADQTFICEHCGRVVPGNPPGTEHRNHCPHCLWSLHVDMHVGDRRSGCRSGMEPIAIAVRYDGEWAVVHRCKKCQTIRTNRVAGDDNALTLLALAVRPLARPPFPLDTLLPKETASLQTEPAAQDVRMMNDLQE